MIYRKHPIRSLLTSMLRKENIRYTLSPSKSIKGSNYGKFLKDKNVLLCTRLYKYAPNLESLLTQQYVCVMCTLWSDNTCVFTCFHSVKNANTQLIWSSVHVYILHTCLYKIICRQWKKVFMWLKKIPHIFLIYHIACAFYEKHEQFEKNLIVMINICNLQGYLKPLQTSFLFWNIH